MKNSIFKKYLSFCVLNEQTFFIFIQWLTAGKGIVHCEWSHGQEKAHGLQLWINLAKKEKMQEPSCQEMTAESIPVASKEGIEVKVIAGEAFGVKVRNFHFLLFYRESTRGV